MQVSPRGPESVNENVVVNSVHLKPTELGREHVRLAEVDVVGDVSSHALEYCIGDVSTRADRDPKFPTRLKAWQ